MQETAYHVVCINRDGPTLQTLHFEQFAHAMDAAQSQSQQKRTTPTFTNKDLIRIHHNTRRIYINDTGTPLEQK